jgi:hypothetical protein
MSGALEAVELGFVGGAVGAGDAHRADPTRLVDGGLVGGVTA